ncbi:MAG: hypothetical protein QHC78_20465 [Pigmentiphaga sp.]|uniref:hypothetical protein n=1 Tax=Pigmentiphaga sp. TaxID=1977564 RepID=UPI0029A5E7F7|nr:hypothetical protein [Pigmentiphaga sp.]MDX3908068.1 hypothetical protein [Pigmentiphaga sp.]
MTTAQKPRPAHGGPTDQVMLPPASQRNLPLPGREASRRTEGQSGKSGQASATSRRDTAKRR